jgi:hypothetical protein
MYFFQGNRSTEKRQAGQRRNHLSWPQEANDDSKTIQKWLSQGITYLYFGNGKKQVPGVETTVAVIEVLESSI